MFPELHSFLRVRSSTAMSRWPLPSPKYRTPFADTGEALRPPVARTRCHLRWSLQSAPTPNARSPCRTEPSGESVWVPDEDALGGGVVPGDADHPGLGDQHARERARRQIVAIVGQDLAVLVLHDELGPASVGRVVEHGGRCRSRRPSSSAPGSWRRRRRGRRSAARRSPRTGSARRDPGDSRSPWRRTRPRWRRRRRLRPNPTRRRRSHRCSARPSRRTPRSARRSRCPPGPRVRSPSRTGRTGSLLGRTVGQPTMLIAPHTYSLSNSVICIGHPATSAPEPRSRA